MKSYIQVTTRYLKVQKKRTILTILGIVLSVALITGIGTIMNGIREYFIMETISEYGDYHAYYENVPAEKVDLIRANVKVKDSYITAGGGAAILSEFSGEERDKSSISLPPYRYLVIEGYDSKAMDMLPVNITEGRRPEAPGEIAVYYWTLEYMPGNPGIGDTVTLDTGKRVVDGMEMRSGMSGWSDKEEFRREGARQYTIVGLIGPQWGASSVRTMAFGMEYLDDKTMDRDQYKVYIKLNSLRKAREKTRKIFDDAGLSYDNNNRFDYNDQLLALYGMSPSDSFNASLWGIFIFITGLVMVSTVAVIYNAFHISVLERVNQFGLLRCVGATPVQIRRIVTREATILGLLGIPPGILSGLAAMNVLFYVVRLFNSDYQLADIPVMVSPVVVAISVVLGFVTVYLSAWGPSQRAGKVPALDAVRNTGSIVKENIKKGRKAFFTKLLLGAEGVLAWKNLRRNRKRFIITVFSMVISITLYIVFSSMMDFAVRTSVINLNETGDYYIYPGESITNSDYIEINKLPGVRAAYWNKSRGFCVKVPRQAVRSEYMELAGRQLPEDGTDMIFPDSRLLCYGDAVFEEVERFVAEGRIDTEAMNSNDGVVLIKTARWYNPNDERTITVDTADIHAGDAILVTEQSPDPGNSEYRPVVVHAVLEKGILHDEHTPKGGFILITTEEVFEQLVTIPLNPGIHIILENNTEKGAVDNYLAERAERDADFKYTDYVERVRKERNTAMILQIFFMGFVAVITAIGSLNIINTITTNLIIRTREMSMLRAVGMSMNGIRKMVFLESMYYGLIAGILGGTAGTFLAYVLYRLVGDVRYFTWNMPWKHILIAVLGAELVALLSGYFPLRRLNRGVIMQHMRMEE